MNDKISIIIPCYNDADFIEQSVNSALDQDYEDIEIIVIDDGSNTHTKAILERLKPRITKLIAQQNSGASASRNIGISQASGEYILTLDSDDFFEPSFCKKAVSILQSKPEVRLVSCYARRFDLHKEEVIKYKTATLEDFLKFNRAIGNSLYRKRDWEQIGGYDENMNKGYEDWEFYIRLMAMGGVSYIIPEVLFNYRLKHSSNSTRADKIKYDLLLYIYLKHQDLYKRNFKDFMIFLLGRLEIVEKAERKNLDKLEFRIGFAILTPIRKLKKLINF